MINLDEDKIIRKIEEKYWLDKARDARMKPLPPSWSISSDTVRVLETEISDAIVLGGLNKISQNDPDGKYVILLAVLKILIYKYTGQTDIVVSAPPGISASGGVVLTGNPELPTFFRTSLGHDEGVISLIRDLGKQLVANRARLTTDLAALQEKFRTIYMAEYESLLQVGFLMGGKAPCWFGEMGISFDLLDKGSSISLRVVHKLSEQSDGWLLAVTRHFQRILAQVAVNPGLNIGQVSLFDREEKEQILFGLNDSGFVYEASGVTRLLEREVVKAPGAIALVFKEKRYTYQALNHKVNRLAHFLTGEFQAGPGKVIAVMLERSEWSAIMMLAIIKTGACYLPLDPALPGKRLRYITGNAGPVVLLTGGEQMKALTGEATDCPVVDIEEMDLDGYSIDDLRVVVDLDSPSFLIYTSGSTGEPKGVVQTHRTLLNLILWDNHAPGFARGSSILQYSSFAFDSSLHDIYYALSSGGSVHIIAEEIRSDYTALAAYIVRSEINILSFPFSVMASFFNTVDPGLLAGHAIRHIISTGEQLLIGSNLIGFLRDNPDIRLHNFYGPSETHVVTAYSVTGRDFIPKRAPIGKPIFNSQIYILNDRLELLPIGMTGEVYIGGDNLAIGYLADPVLSAAKFVDNPLVAGKKMYKSGDLGRWLPGGDLEYLGRIDNQIKIRGYRVELSEIEKRLLQYDAVSDAVVIDSGKGEDKQLIAYIILRPGGDISHLPEYLAQYLPDHMLPSHCIPIDQFPLTPNGKLDKRKLPMPLMIPARYAAPESPVEKILVEIWESALNRTGIGVEDNFFEIGGHSLKATRIISAVYKRLNRKITLKNIFLQPTIRQLASIIRSGDEVLFQDIPRLPDESDYELSHSQKRIWVLEQFTENALAYVLPMAFEIRGNLDAGALNDSFQKMVERHESLRTVFVNKEGNPRQVIKAPGAFAFSLYWEDLSMKEAAERDESIRIHMERDASTSFDLGRGPLLRGALFRMDPHRHIFLFAIHHIISDGWSMDIFMKELMIFYHGRVKGVDAGLPPLRIHYKDFSDWQNRQLDGHSAASSRSYWLSRFQGEIPVLDLPTDYNRLSGSARVGQQVVFDLSSGMTAQIRSYCEKKDVSLFIFLLAVVKTLLFRYTGQQDIITGTPVNGRDHPDLEGQIGVFINTLPIRSALSAHKLFSGFITELRDIVTEAYHHQGYPFDRLVDELRLDRDKNRNPLFDVLVKLDILEDVVKDEGELAVETIGGGTGVSNFDLVFNFDLVDGALRLIIGYNAGLYREETIGRMGEHIQGIAARVLDSDSIALGDIRYLSSGDNALLGEWNRTAGYLPDRTIDQLAAALAADNPLGIAIEEAGSSIGEAGCSIGEAGSSITYRDLHLDSNRVAACLHAGGGEPGEVIAVIAVPGILMIKLLLGVLKAGCAYLPIDPDTPATRAAYMLQDAGVKRMLAGDPAYITRLDLDPARCMVIDRECRVLEDYPTADLELVRDVDEVACIYYTSGSTGKPKGVMLAHAGLVNRIEWFWRNFDCTKKDIYLFKTMFTFDVSMSEMFMPVCFGCRMLILPTTVLNDPQALSQAVERHGVTIIHFSPTLLNSFIERVDPAGWERLGSLRYVLSSGEALPRNVVQVYYGHLQTPLVNLYGPTEASIEVSWHICAKEEETVPIGKPIANVGLHILDERGSRVPPGIAGEICISGIALAKGYLNKKEMTRERFVTVDIDGDPTRVYKTGDQGKWNYRGLVEYLGRKDNQVSIGGYRIELGEIEENILQEASVGNVCVRTMVENDGSTSLAAYIVKKEKAAGVVDMTYEEQAAATGEELERILAFNDRYSVYEEGVLFHELFERQVAETPDADALFFGQTRWTYLDLNQRANRLASGLRRTYLVKPEEKIVILAERSEKLPLSMFGILKAGAAFLPIDPGTPRERIIPILEDCGCRLLITDKRDLAGSLRTGISVIDIDRLDEAFGAESPENILHVNKPSDAAYVIYTSGTTGKPKGVIIEHRNIGSAAAAWINDYRLGSFKPHVFQVASMGFDVFVGDICRSLLAAGCITICPSDSQYDLAYLARTLVESKISVFESTPALIIPLMNLVAGEYGQLPDLKLLLIGSDVLSVKDYTAVRRQLSGDCRVMNSYGTTETTVDSCYFEGEAVVNERSPVLSIGKPMTNTCCYILDKALHPVGIGITGELFIGGSGVGRGYINNASATADRFMADPYMENSRMYRTGDLAYWLPDGNIQLVGRSDHQVKIRGLRIETEEIQGALEALDGIEKALVLAVADGGDNCLVAYYKAEKEIDKERIAAFLAERLPKYMIPGFFVHMEHFPLNANGKVDKKAFPVPLILYQDGVYADEIRTCLRSRLPDYMVPSRFVLLPAFPLTSSGKIDRRRLPDPLNLIDRTHRAFVFPRNAWEAEHVKIWQEVLLLDRVSINDNFFDLGGHSLRGIQLIYRLNRQMGTTYRLADLVNCPTIEKLIGSPGGRQERNHLLVPLGEISEGKPAIFLIPPIAGSAVVFAPLAERLKDRFNCYGIQYSGLGRGEALDTSIEGIADRSRLILQQVNKGNKCLLLGYSMGVLVAFEMAKKLEEQGMETVLFLVDRHAAGGDGFDPAGLDENIRLEVQRVIKQYGIGEDEEMTATYIDMYKNNVKLLSAYSPGGGIKGAVSVFESTGSMFRTTMQDWKEKCSGPFFYHELAGNHDEVFVDHNLRIIGAAIGEFII